MNLTDYSAILFDMDGTLVDSETLWRIAEKDTVANHGATLSPEVQDLFTGIRVNESAQIMRNTYGITASVSVLVDEIHERVKKLLPKVEDQLGAVKLIEHVAQLALPKAIVSNSTIDIIETTLAYKAWATHFDFRFSAEHVEHAKPAPDLYLLAASELKVNISQTLVFEDSLTGVKSAVSAGATCVAIPEQHDPAFKALTPHVFDSLEAFMTTLA